MIYDASPIAVILFAVFVIIVLGLSFYFARKTKSAEGYFAAGGKIHWAVNGIAFAGDYLSAASFLGICGMIALKGYDGFLYSIGYLAGWIVALFLVAEPLKRLGKFTFTDALDSKFNSKKIQLSAAISTLIVSIFYLIPQMVGAGVLVTPLLGLPHWVGVVIVGVIVITIVATAGMASTTYVQFLKGSLLIIFSTVLAVYIFQNGLTLTPNNGTEEGFHEYVTLTPTISADGKVTGIEEDYDVLATMDVKDHKIVKIDYEGAERWFNLVDNEGNYELQEMLSVTHTENEVLYNGKPKEDRAFYQIGYVKEINGDPSIKETGALGPLKFLAAVRNSKIVIFKDFKFDSNGDGNLDVRVWAQEVIDGKKMLMPGLKFKIGEGSTPLSILNFISLMLALFLGTASLPHILIRYYTVPSQKAARKSTIVAIAAIGFFYILTLFMGLGAAMTGVIDPESSNMSAPLLAKAFGIVLFSIISAIAFATVLGTVSGLIVASSGAIAHDFIDKYLGKNLTDKKKVKAGKIAAFAVGIVAIVLGISFKGMNVSFLVGWAFAVASSANLPAIIMLLFWKKTTAKGIAYSIIVGIVGSLGIILTSPTMWDKYGFDMADAPHKLNNPALISVTLAFLTLVIVSLLTQKDNKKLTVQNAE